MLGNVSVLSLKHKDQILQEYEKVKKGKKGLEAVSPPPNEELPKLDAAGPAAAGAAVQTRNTSRAHSRSPEGDETKRPSLAPFTIGAYVKPKEDPKDKDNQSK